MARLLLIQPPVEDFYATAVRSYPLGLLYVAAEPLAAGHSVTLLDTLSTGTHKVIPTPEKFQYLNEFYRPGDKSPYRLFGHYYRFGMDWDDIGRRILTEKPDFIGISSLFTPYHSSAVRISEIAKQVCPDVPVIMGGAHVSVCGAGSACVDYEVKGEGDSALLEIMGGSRPADTELFPARELISPDRYQYGPKRMAFILTSRGCPHGCSFCSVHGVFKNYRPRAPESVLWEIKECVSRWGITHFDIEDDNFGYSRAEALAVLDGIIALQRPDISFSLMNGVCADVLDNELLLKMKQAGFSELNLSLVSAVPEMSGHYHRPFDAAVFGETVKRAQSMGFAITAYVILGLPADTLDNMAASIAFLHGLGVKIGPSLFYPVPGTPAYRECARKGWLKNMDYDFFRLTAAAVETPAFDRNDLMTLFRVCRVLNADSTDERIQTVWRERQWYHYFRNRREPARLSERAFEKVRALMPTL